MQAKVAIYAFTKQINAYETSHQTNRRFIVWGSAESIQRKPPLPQHHTEAPTFYRIEYLGKQTCRSDVLVHLTGRSKDSCRR